jgi:hypothetical protein
MGSEVINYKHRVINAVSREKIERTCEDCGAYALNEYIEPSSVKLPSTCATLGSPAEKLRLEKLFEFAELAKSTESAEPKRSPNTCENVRSFECKLGPTEVSMYPEISQLNTERECATCRAYKPNEFAGRDGLEARSADSNTSSREAEKVEDNLSPTNGVRGDGRGTPRLAVDEKLPPVSSVTLAVFDSVIENSLGLVPSCYGGLCRWKGFCFAAGPCREKYRLPEIKEIRELSPYYSKLDVDFCRQWLATLHNMAESRQRSGDKAALAFFNNAKPFDPLIRVDA